jgi:broad specificity phosphatase PhoE
LAILDHFKPFQLIPSPGASSGPIRRATTRGFVGTNPGKHFTPTPSTGQAIDMPANSTRSVVFRAAAALAVVITIGACSGAPHPRNIILTFVRHAESQANADGIIDTSIPGPDLTEEGRAQAEQVAHQLNRNRYDGIYASPVVRTQQTAAPLARELGMRVEILPGLREIQAGWYEGASDKNANLTYMVALADWLNGDLNDAMPGSINGHQFNDQFTAAVQQIYDSGHTKPVAFSHGASIAFWTLMNVKNPKNSLITSHRLPNASRVVLTGNPMTGWTLVDWDGIHDFSY